MVLYSVLYIYFYICKHLFFYIYTELFMANIEREAFWFFMPTAYAVAV